MAVSLKTLASFTFGNGAFPFGSLIMDASGNLYGTTTRGGSTLDHGVVFELAASSGQITDLHVFNAMDGNGSTPIGSLTMDALGNFYGTTTINDGGGPGGSVFALLPFRGGYTITTLSQLGGSAGGSPESGLYLAPDGTVIGTTSSRGANDSGAVFTIAPNSTTAVGTPFPDASGSAGPNPISAPIEYGGLLYSTTEGDGTVTHPGTIFSFDPRTATVTTVASFDQTIGFAPQSGVVADGSGNLYGTTHLGPGHGAGGIYEYDATAHAIKSLASFDSASGTGSYGNLLRDAAGDLFGTTSAGGAYGNGTVFELRANASKIDVLYNFGAAGAADGSSPTGGLIADASGNLYGITYAGGAGNFGTVFELQGSDFVVCFASGTRIRTLRGGCAVEDLVVGDIAITASGAARSIIWIGHRDTDCRGHHDLCPVRVAAHAFGNGVPARDLYLSPGHPILVGADEDNEGGHLVPIMCLINGTTIERVAVDEVTYWHVELDAHDILLAEGLPAESYIDLGSRPWFAGADGALYDPDKAAPGMPGRCRPVAITGLIVEAERRRLDQVFAMRLASASAWPDLQNALLALF